MKRKTIVTQNVEAKQFLEENGLATIVKQIWECEDVQLQVSKAYINFIKYGEELVKSTPKEIQVKGLTYLGSISKETFNQDGFMVYECNIKVAKEAMDVVKLELTEVEMFEDARHSIQEAAEIFLKEMLESIYEIPSYFEVKISRFCVKELI